MSEQQIEELADEVDDLHDALEEATKEELRLREVNAELLAALKACIREDAGDMLNWAAAVKNARAAIAKAEGTGKP